MKEYTFGLSIGVFWLTIDLNLVTRPSVNYAKDSLDQLFLFHGVVWSVRGFHLWMWAFNNHFPVY